MQNLNPFNEPLGRLSAIAKDLMSRHNAIVARLKWFDGTNEQVLSSDLRACHATVDDFRCKIKKTIGEIDSNIAIRDRMALEIRSSLNPISWFAEDQRQLRQTKDEIIRKIGELHRVQNELKGSLKLAETKLNETSLALESYKDFNAEEHRADQRDIEAKFQSIGPELSHLFKRWKEVDLALKPVVDQMRQYEDLRTQLSQRRDRAAALENQLNNATNPQQKALVHGQCEAQFQVGSPRMVVLQCDKELRRIKNDYDKAHSRAVELGVKAARRIDSIVIDGNNLCYENRTFVGAAVLDTLVPLLLQDYTVTIVFDPSIHRMLNMDDRNLAAHFGEKVRVHVVATGAKADETLLDIASAEQYAYVLSNDRFGEFNDKEVVKRRRLIQHEIFDRRILIHDLGVDSIF